MLPTTSIGTTSRIPNANTGVLAYAATVNDGFQRGATSKNGSIAKIPAANTNTDASENNRVERNAIGSHVDVPGAKPPTT